MTPIEAGDAIPMRRVLLISLGTAGDVLPFVGVGIALQRRGHDVTLMANGHFESLAHRHGFDFVPIGSEQEYHDTLANPDLWHPVRGPLRLARLIFESLEAQYEAILSHAKVGGCVLVASGAAFAARIAHETHGFPLVTLILQPAMLRSVYHPPVIAGFPSVLGRAPRFALRGLFRAVDVFTDRALGASRINAFRARVGLAPVKRFMNDWWLSPQMGIALFPDWFGMPQIDWPCRVKLTGFPLFDDATATRTLSPDVEAVLACDTPPIVFTPGTGMMHGRAFFLAAIEACRALGRRGLLLTRYRRQLPDSLPDCVLHAEYVPFTQVLPRAAALVHHGGVGTTAQAIAAGIPQLIMPMSFDQPDNAARVKTLGVGDWLRPRAFTPRKVARKLDSLLTSTGVAQSCAELASQLRGADPIPTICDLVESVA